MLVRDVRVVDQHLHLEAERPPRHLGADPPQPDQPERLARQLGAHKLRPLPLAVLHQAVGQRDVARQREHQRQGVLGGGDGVAARAR